jgi:hypothetical protein
MDSENETQETLDATALYKDLHARVRAKLLEAVRLLDLHKDIQRADPDPGNWEHVATIGCVHDRAIEAAVALAPKPTEDGQ